MPPHLCPKPLALDDFFAHFLIHTLKQIQDKKFGKPTLRARKGWITWTIATNGLDKQPYPNLKVVKNKIDRNKLIKEYKSKKARVPPVEVHVKIADINVGESLENAIAVVLYELGVFCARRKMEIHQFTTQNISYEIMRTVGNSLKPRVSLDISANKEDSTGQIRDNSLHGSRETVLTCRCKSAHNFKSNTADCPITAFDTLWRYRMQLYIKEKKQ